jgi:restriction-modification enzyme MmeI-like protein
MTPQQFIRKWSASTLKERSAAQEHFIDLCHVLNEPTPVDADPRGEWFCFERGAKKTGAGDGWADVWRNGCFAWEYKGKHKDLDKAFAQLQRYAIALRNPPLLVVSDMEKIEIHTNFTNTVEEIHRIPIADLGDAKNLQKLKWLFSEPERLKPGQTKTALTEGAAERFADLAEILRNRGGEPERVAHFLNRILFCFFAQHSGLLPSGVVERVLQSGVKHPEQATTMLRLLFGAMKKGGPFGADVIDWFNGGLFDSDDAIPLEREDIGQLLSVASMDWSAIEPSIFGTLFERGLDPGKRNQIGAHYTDPQSIMRIVDPVIREPLAQCWHEAYTKIKQILARSDVGRDQAARTRAYNAAQKEFNQFLHHLTEFRVLDPACGSGNFLYLALQTLKDLEHQATLEAEVLGLKPPLEGMHVGVRCVRGIELNTYAAELARVTVWIGEIQWMLRHGMAPAKNPILKSLRIDCRDAVLAPEGHAASWPEANVIIGNPPFLGDKKMMRALGSRYVDDLRRTYHGKVPGGADFVTYWFERAREQIEAKQTEIAGLVATNSIRGGASRKVLDRITETTRIFEAWSDEPWVNEGAAVRVSVVCFGNRPPVRLDGKPVAGINADLTVAGMDLTKARKLRENEGACFYATVKAGGFDVDGVTARRWLQLPNPHGKANSDVVKPWANAMDVTRRASDKWVVDFGVEMPLAEAMLYEAPFAHVRNTVKPERDKTRREKYRKVWWLFAEPIPGMRAALRGGRRYIATPAVAKHRLFVWMHKAVVPDHALVVIARDDDPTFGILHSRFHELWSLRLCSWLGVGNDPRYTPTTTFETFPFPDGLTCNLTPAEYTNSFATEVGEKASRLCELRDAWLNPKEWIERDNSDGPQYPQRVLPRAGHEADLKARTLTNLYNQRPAWLEHAHAELDMAVARAYGWGDYTAQMSDDEILTRLLRLNLNRAADLFIDAAERSRKTFKVIKTQRSSSAGTKISRRTPRAA